MRKYTLKDLKEDLEKNGNDSTRYCEEKEKANDKNYYIVDLVYGGKTLVINEKDETMALCNYLHSRLQVRKRATKCIDLGCFGSYPNRYLHYDDLEETYIIYPTAIENENIKKTLDYIRQLTNEQGKRLYYFEEPRYEDDLYTLCENYLSFYQRELTYDEQTREPYRTYFYTCNKIEPYANERTRERLTEEEGRKSKLRDYNTAFKTIFDECLHFNIDLNLGNEKIGGVREQMAKELINDLGDYNDFGYLPFCEVIDFCNKNFIKYYNEGNPNNYRKDYTIRFGREGSVVMYLEFNVDNDKRDEVIRQLDHLSNADERDIVREFEGWSNNKHIEYRLWWD